MSESLHVMAEIKSTQKQLDEIQQKMKQQSGAQNAKIKSAVVDVQSAIENILTNKKDTDDPGLGLQEAYANLGSAFRVVKTGDRAVPSQAIAVYNESSQQVKGRITEWERVKQTRLTQLNEQLRKAHLAPVEQKPADIQ